MFKILIADSVKSSIISDLKKKVILQFQYDWEVSRALDFSIGSSEVFERLYVDLSLNPFLYPIITKDIRVVIEAYLPYFLFYKIKNDTIYIFEKKDKMDLFNLDS